MFVGDVKPARRPSALTLSVGRVAIFMASPPAHSSATATGVQTGAVRRTPRGAGSVAPEASPTTTILALQAHAGAASTLHSEADSPGAGLFSVPAASVDYTSATTELPDGPRRRAHRCD